MDWDVLFENELIPLVAAAQSEAALEKSVGLVIHSLFRRADDAGNRDQFSALLQVSLARAKTLGEKVDSAVEFLRLVKSTRKSLATESPAKRVRDGGVSSDINRITQQVAPPPVPVAAPPPPPPPPAPEKVDFPTVFDRVVCGYLCDVLAVLRIDEPGSLRLPFLLHPAFAEVMEKVARAHILPAMRESRHIKALGDSHNWAEGGPRELLRIITAGEINNPVLHTWDNRWGELASRRLPGKTGKSLPPPARAVWKAFAEHAEANGYAAPAAGDITLFLTLPRFDLGRLRAAWRELEQLYRQEFRPGQHQDQARDGALRDGLIKWEGREGMPPHAVEWLAIKACTAFPYLGLPWLERFSTNKGKTEEERDRAVPFIMQVLQGK